MGRTICSRRGGVTHTDIPNIASPQKRSTTLILKGLCLVYVYYWLLWREINPIVAEENANECSLWIPFPALTVLWSRIHSSCISVLYFCNEHRATEQRGIFQGKKHGIIRITYIYSGMAFYACLFITFWRLLLKWEKRIMQIRMGIKCSHLHFFFLLVFVFSGWCIARVNQHCLAPFKTGWQVWVELCMHLK